ncbi:MAG: acylneuraminate cytidylyltransferase family protein [Desulfamplus sp.]|nr:acylneuraminate cytidylyltransferase family protein [Desulfamplus sp.]
MLAIIPARGGSKGLPGKNIYPLCGKPLIAYSIEAAQKCKSVDRIIVSTDSYEIAEVARSYGAEVPWLRPLTLSGDKADLGSVIGSTLWQLESQGYIPDAHVVLLPTSPFRTRGLLNYLCSMLEKGCKSVNTVRSIKPRLFCEIDSSGVLHPLQMKEFYDSKKKFFKSYGLLGG